MDSLAFKLLLKGGVIFNYAVMHNGKKAVFAQVGMGVFIARPSVGCPARVADSDRCGALLMLCKLLFKNAQPAALFGNAYSSVFHYGNAG